MSEWDNAGAVQMVRTLWLDGMDAGRISKELAKIGVNVTRSSVLGKVHRMGLARRASQARPVRGVRPKHLGKSVKVAPAPKIPRTAASPLNEYGAKRPPLTSERPHALRWVDHKDFIDCAMFCHGESGDAGLVCSQPARGGGVYCSDCSRVSYVPTERQKREAA